MSASVIHLPPRKIAPSGAEMAKAGLPAGYARLVNMIESTIPRMEQAVARGGPAYLGPIVVVYRWALEELAAAEATASPDVRSIAMICSLLERLADALPGSIDAAAPGQPIY